MSEPSSGAFGAPILVATDFSPDSEAAFRWAAKWGARSGAPLLVLHVVHDPAEHPGSYARHTSHPIERLEEVARSLLDEWLERMRAQMPEGHRRDTIESRVVVGIPETRILEIAKETGAQLIAMGGRGQSAIADLLLGSRAERVTRLAPIPVVIVKPGFDDPSPAARKA